MEKLIITLALLGNVPTKKLNASTPISPAEIADTLDECGKLGVSIGHIHARDEKEEPTHEKSAFKNILEAIKSRGTDIITQFSTGARGGSNTIETRSQMLDLPCEMASLATGSSNFPTSINANPPDLIEALCKKMRDNNIKPEIEVTPIREIDGRIIKSNGRGPITEQIQTKFFEAVKGQAPQYDSWLEYV